MQLPLPTTRGVIIWDIVLNLYIKEIFQCVYNIIRICINTCGFIYSRKLAEFFKISMIRDKYNALRVTLMNRSEGKIDSQLIRLGELWGVKSFNGNDIDPHIWKYNDEVSWYCYTPSVAELKALSQSVDDYLECFAEPSFEETEKMEMSM